MADGTHIEWTDATWNIVNGCSVLSPGCTNCYAMRLAGTRLKHHESRAGLTIDTKAGPVWTGEVRFNDKALLDPLRWRRPRRIFVCAHGDLFHDKVPVQWLDQIFAVMAAAPQHVFQVLTKRPETLLEYANDAMGCGEHWLAHVERSHAPMWPLPNVWLGVSVEDQKRADERIPLLLQTPAAVRWLSCEPLLGPVTLNYLQPGDPPTEIDALNGTHGVLRPHGGKCAKIGWVVAGGESGPGARPMHPDWARSLRDQCAAAGVPFLFKQWGAWGLGRYQNDVEAASCGTAWPDGTVGRGDAANNGGLGTSLYRRNKKDTGRDLDGVRHDGFPARSDA